MPQAAKPSRAEPHADYRRRARRIRSVFRTQPTVRMRALCELAATQDGRRVERPATDPIVPLPAGAAQTFANLVRERMDGPVLRYSHRANLLLAAERSGIGRFEANLVIAAVQHQAGADKPTVTTPDARRMWMPAALAVATTQLLIAVALWWVVG